MSNKKYSFDEKNRFVIEDYDKAKTFSSFLPGIAGVKGIPMWTFYVNRGQGICSFGVKDKNSPIMEFSPANIAYKNVPVSGFRTFIKLKDTGKVIEPFAPTPINPKIKRNMYVSANQLTIEEVNNVEGLKVTVDYFNIPETNFAGLVRKVVITNLKGEDVEVEVLDGMPEILPYGVENAAYKEVGNLLRSWMEVYNMENQIPYYHVRASMGDEAEVSEVTKGHFYLTFTEEEKLITPIVDAELVFGQDQSLQNPERFMSNSLTEIMNSSQVTANKVPCGFTPTTSKIGSNKSHTICSIIGHVSSIELIQNQVDEMTSINFIEEKQRVANELVKELTNTINTSTSSNVFNEYARQSYLDNLLRGGYPYILENGKDGFVYHLFSRKHGDLERDYNFFSIAPEYYSQGNGNFRDANQNRRNDIYFNPKVGRFNVKMFMSLIQADGYNPLSVEGCSFTIKNDNKASVKDLLERYVNSHKQELEKLLQGKFTPGKIVNYLTNENVDLSISEDEFLVEVLKLSEQNIEASFGEGFWVDHWTYNMDLVESYLDIYPEQLEDFMFVDSSYTFFDSPVYVLPRSEKYVLSKGKVRQYGSILEDEEKMEKLGISLNDTNWLRTNHGLGDIYKTNLFVKLVSLSLNKFATLDPFGMGIEMEANKPGWNDAMNGLPGIFGSGLSETFELKRVVQFVLSTIKKVKNQNVNLPNEIYTLMQGVAKNLEAYKQEELTDFTYWDVTSSLREEYRKQIRFGIDGKEQEMNIEEIEAIFKQMLWKLNKGIEKAKEIGNGLYPTYLSYEAVEFEKVKDEAGKQIISHYGLPKATVKAFTVEALPYFLEGPARAFKTIEDSGEAKEIYSKIKDSDLYDKKINMYKTSVSLNGQSHEIGRIKAFTPGWLERESVFLHMSYKYLLSIFKAGLYDEYFNEMKTSLIPFIDPDMYGRSILENSSFIASSVNPDQSVHGRGFVARLSGSTAEFLSMWTFMMIGKKPFKMEDDELTLSFSPILPGWLFKEDGTLSFNFLGHTEVVYNNEDRKNTYGENKPNVESFVLHDENGEKTTVQEKSLKGEQAMALRNGKYTKVEVFLR
ncbi:cellobiose phosphorylase [Lottiidibacillus patelloidae]|uniref:Cellobiose phosphorylase n=1 Tax=Lottiidibacillus patelloidae TaxID=2670334 RepID=A0A263BWN2_9BACI|nr:cellobiose phosphorylase [Lottiidibacillus patelloidae]OZM58070.1 cellobiose phosphorylase [Lottiidibacillus patelloidae]